MFSCLVIMILMEWKFINSRITDILIGNISLKVNYLESLAT